MFSLPFSVTLLGLVTILVFLGLGQRVLDRMRLTGFEALLILIVMVIGHFLPTISLSEAVALNLGGLIPFGVVLYLLLTTSGLEQRRALGVSLATAILIWLTDKLLPTQPGLLDPVFSGGIFAGLLATVFGRSRRAAFIGGMLGVLLVDLANLIQLRLDGIQQQITIGSGGIFSSLVISAFLAVAITEIIGEVREYIHIRGERDD